MQDSVDEFQLKRKNHLLSLTRKKVIRIVAIFLIWSFVITYFCLPVSKMKGIDVNGNVFLSDTMVIDIAHINSKTFRWDFSSDKANDLLNNYEFGNYSIIEKAKVKNTIIDVEINVKENFPLGLLGDEVVLSNGEMMTLEEYETIVPKIYRDAVGVLPILDISLLREESLDDFIKHTSNVTKGYIELRKNKTILNISNSIVEAAPGEEVYATTFNETYANKNIILVIYVSDDRYTTKMTLDNYNKILESVIDKIKDNEENDITVKVDYIGSWKIIEE